MFAPYQIFASPSHALSPSPQFCALAFSGEQNLGRSWCIRDPLFWQRRKGLISRAKGQSVACEVTLRPQAQVPPADSCTWAEWWGDPGPPGSVGGTGLRHPQQAWQQKRPLARRHFRSSEHRNGDHAGAGEGALPGPQDPAGDQGQVAVREASGSLGSFLLLPTLPGGSFLWGLGRAICQEV